MTLQQLKKHQRARIVSLPNDFQLASQLLEQGFTPRAKLQLAHKAPLKGPLAFQIDNTLISIQSQIAAQIEVELVNE